MRVQQRRHHSSNFDENVFNAKLFRPFWCYKLNFVFSFFIFPWQGWGIKSLNATIVAASHISGDCSEGGLFRFPTILMMAVSAEAENSVDSSSQTVEKLYKVLYLLVTFGCRMLKWGSEWPFLEFLNWNIMTFRPKQMEKLDIFSNIGSSQGWAYKGQFGVHSIL